MAFIEILDIDDRADVKLIKEKLIDRYQYFGVLVSTAPTMQLKAIYQKKLSDLKALAEKYSCNLDTFSGSGRTSPVGEATPSATKGNQSLQQAFLVLHTEGMPLRSFSLLRGINVLGRHQGEVRPTILIDDEFMSKAHAVVEMVHIEDKVALLYDIGELSGYKPSTNGVYLNGRDTRITGKLALHEGDTLQVGYSKLVLTYSAAGQQQEAAAAVGKRDHSKTVFIKVN